MDEERQGRWNKVKIYLDSYIVTSFWLHLLCLYLGRVIQKKQNEKTGKGRLLLSAFVCALADTVTVILFLKEGKVSLPVVIGVVPAELFLGTWIAYGRRRLLQNGVLVFGITALLAGGFQLLPVRNIGLFCMAGTLLLPFLRGGFLNLFRTKQVQQFQYEATLHYNMQKKCVAAFMDTGNRLRLYGSSVPVVLVDEVFLTDWIKEAEVKTPQKLVFIPYKGVGGKGILQGLRLHCRIVTGYRSVTEGEVAAVAAEHKLFHGCMYQMILQPEVLSMVCVTDTQEGENHVI